MHFKRLILLLLFPLMGSACASKDVSIGDRAIRRQQQQSRAELAQQCQGRDGWSDVAPPAHIFGNVYMVGTCGIVSLLITSEKGHILIDGATEKAAPSIAENIRKLGFNPTDVRYLLSSHEHIDHVGGLAALKRITGARLIARKEASAAIESGVPDKTDPQAGSLLPFSGIKVDRLIQGGDTIKLGALEITAFASPGHAPGGTSWMWKSCQNSKCYNFVYADSLGAVSADSYRFSDHPEYVAIFRNTIERIAKIQMCDILITPHPAQSQFFERLSNGLLAEKNGCAIYAKTATEKLNARLEKEAIR
jgi:metallo-beta-lactamase class B